ncbi:MAG: threonylcarbamoyl-AMP synthase [Muribaculaceae bacterium]|nr:threonylcarbamoyl-AMP synthase [Muribaculaceae bacterium]
MKETADKAIAASGKGFAAEARRAAEVMKRGGIVVYPTDTVWGIGCDATNDEAVRRIYEIKRRDDHKAMIVLASSPAEVERYTEGVPEIAFELMEAAEGSRPVTIIYDKGRMLAPSLLGPGGSVGIRVTCEEFSRELCRAMRRPIVSTSANISGEPAAALFSEISREILDAADYVVECRREETERRRPSSVIRLTNDGVVTIIRE